MGICKSCRWFANVWSSERFFTSMQTCKRPIAKDAPASLIDGKFTRPLYRPAEYERAKPGIFWDRDKCGPNGRYWEEGESS